MRDLLTATGSIVFARETARRYIQSAIRLLDILPVSESHDSLQRLASMIIDRDQ